MAEGNHVPAWITQAEIMTNIIQMSEHGGASSSYRLYDVGSTGAEGPGRYTRENRA